MATLRTTETKEKYQAYRAAGGLDGVCVLCEAPALQTFKHWKIVDNKFPYDRIASTHHMLVPQEHLAADAILGEAWGEFQALKKGVLSDTYQFFIEAAVREQSIPEHFHLHLIVAKSE